jgi:hypothetical protein
MSDPTKKEVPINPPQRNAIDLWRMYWMQCNLTAGLSSGPDEKVLKDNNEGKSPSELKRMKEATGTTKQ